MEPSRQFEDFLAQHGLSKASQYAATMRAAAVPASDFEGEYPQQGTYNLGHPLLKAIGEERIRELKVKKAYEE